MNHRNIRILLFFGLFVSCSFNKYAYRNSDDDQLFGPLYPDYSLAEKVDSAKTYDCNNIFKEYLPYDSSCYIFEYFWANGNCLRSQVYCDSSKVDHSVKIEEQVKLCCMF